MDALHPKWRGGRPRKFTDEMRVKIVEVAKTAPQLVGEPYTHWSLSKLAAYLVKTKVVPEISKERLREILIEEGFSIQRTKTWKWSPDPTSRPSRSGSSVSTRKPWAARSMASSFPSTSMDPSSPSPKRGARGPSRPSPRESRPTTASPTGCASFFFGAYDVAKDQLTGRWSKNKSAVNVLSFFRWVRRRYPQETRIYLVMDNLSSHWTEDIVSWAKNNNVTLVSTPTYASWLNPIETEFGVMVDFVFSGSNYKDHSEIEQALSAYLRRRNTDARRNLAARKAEKLRRRQRRRAAKRTRAELARAA